MNGGKHTDKNRKIENLRNFALKILGIFANIQTKKHGEGVECCFTVLF